MAGEITLQQMFQTETITGVISQFKPTDSVMQRWAGMGVGRGGGENQPGRYVGWDIFNRTRTLAKGRAPGTGPATTTQQPVGHVSAQVFRFHEKIMCQYEYLNRTRAPGAQWGSVDAGGQTYIRRQLEVMMQKYSNTREFVVSRMFRGQFGVAIDGDDWLLCEGDNGTGVAGSDGVVPTFIVDFGVPAANKSQLALGAGGANIIDSPWDDPSTQVKNHLFNLDAAFARLQGRPLRHIWLNSNTFLPLLMNTEFQAIGGSAYRVFDTMTRAEISPDMASAGAYSVVFRACPLFQFHVYNGVLSFYTDGTSTSTTAKIIPDDYAILSPDPDPSWLGLINGSEYVQEDWSSQPKEVYGFHYWKTPVLDPAGLELKFLDNFLPVPYVPTCICYAKVNNF